MVSKIINVVSKKYTSISEAALIISIFTFLSQLLGVVRDRLFAYYIGPTRELDVYLAAFRVPDFLYMVVSTLISATILIPLLHKDKEQKQHDRINSLFTVFTISVILLSIIVAILMPLIAKVLVPGFSSEDMHRLVLLSRIMLFSPVLLGISNFIGSINQYHKKFFLFAFAPVMYNIGLIIGISFLYKYFELVGLAYGVILGALFHLCSQVIAFKTTEFKISMTRNFNSLLVRQVLTMSIPRTLTLSLGTLTLFGLTSLVSFLEPGSISLVTFALNIGLVPLGLVGIPFATALFPYLSSVAESDFEQKKILVEKTLSKIVFFTLFLSVMLIVFRAHIVRVILGTHLFTWKDTTITAALVFIFTIGVIFQNLNQLFVRIYYVENNTKKPLLISSIGFFVTLFLFVITRFTPQNLLGESMLRIFRLITSENSQVILVSFVYILGVILTTALFLWYFKKDHNYSISKSFFNEAKNAIVHMIVLFIISKIFLQIFSFFAYSKTLLGIFIQSALAGLFAVCIWLFYLVMVKNEHGLYIVNRIKYILRKYTFILGF